MAEKMSLVAAYATYKTVKKNPFSWSARSADGKTVAISVWKHAIDFKASPVSYGSIGKEDISNWKDKQGNRNRIEDLKWARDHCDGILRVVVTVAKDVTVKTWEVADCYPVPGLILHLDALNEETGEFVATQIKGERHAHRS